MKTAFFMPRRQWKKKVRKKYEVKVIKWIPIASSKNTRRRIVTLW